MQPAWAPVYYGIVRRRWRVARWLFLLLSLFCTLGSACTTFVVAVSMAEPPPPYPVVFRHLSTRDPTTVIPFDLEAGAFRAEMRHDGVAAAVPIACEAEVRVQESVVARVKAPITADNECELRWNLGMRTHGAFHLKATVVGSDAEGGVVFNVYSQRDPDVPWAWAFREFWVAWVVSGTLLAVAIVVFARTRSTSSS